MKTKLCVIIILFLSVPISLLAQSGESSLRFSPPPIPYIKFYPDVSQYSLTGIYFKMGETEGQSGVPEAMGVNANYAFSEKKFLGIQSGGIVNFSYMNLTLPMALPNSDADEIATDAFGFGFYGVANLYNGEKHDIAGEVVAFGPTVALFIGLQGNFFSINMGPLYQALGNQEEIKARNMLTNYSIGLAGDIPLHYRISLIPYVRYTSSTATVTMKVPKIFTPSELYDATYNTNYSFVDYGADIDIRPFANAPDWVVSMGMALAQIEGLQNGNLLLTLGIKYEVGKYYSNTIIGPAVH